MRLILLGFVLSLLPIWKHEGIEQGVSFWDYLAYMSRTREHIDYDEARQRALFAWSIEHER